MCFNKANSDGNASASETGDGDEVGVAAADDDHKGVVSAASDDHKGVVSAIALDTDMVGAELRGILAARHSQSRPTVNTRDGT